MDIKLNIAALYDIYKQSSEEKQKNIESFVLKKLPEIEMKFKKIDVRSNNTTTS